MRNEYKEKINEFIDEKKVNIEFSKYKNKIKKLNITPELMKIILSKYNKKNFKNVIRLINVCKTREEFNQSIINLFKKEGCQAEALTMISGIFRKEFSKDIYSNWFNMKNNDNVDALLEIDDEIITKLRDSFIDYLNNDNSKKKVFLIDDSNNKINYTLEFDEQKALQCYDDYINSKNLDDRISKVIGDYIYKIAITYDKNTILNDMNFILYDINNKDEKLSINDRKNTYTKFNGLTNDQINKIKNANELIENLCSINSQDTSEMVNKIYDILKNPKERINELEDIYLEYEAILREDIVSNLYVPHNDVEIIDDFRNMHTQLIHLFFRNPYKFKKDISEDIKNDIINKRANHNKDEKLTVDEQKELTRRLQSQDDLLDPAKVNYSFYTKNSLYTDSSGFESYHSDTSNQISASIFSENYFLNSPYSYIGIGFNGESMTPESIAISSDSYLTTNRGLNNLEYPEKYSLEYESSNLETLKQNDGNSEIVMFRRGEDFDTKAAYVFCAIDSSQKESEEILNKAKEIAEKDKLKLVIYDLYKIKKSYDDYMKNQDN